MSSDYKSTQLSTGKPIFLLDATRVITRQDPDSTAITRAFEALKTNKTFLKELGLEREKQYRWFKDFQRIIRGDIDQDGLADAIYVFAIENRGGGNNWDGHYAVFLNKKGKWIYHSTLGAGGDLSPYIINLEAVHNGKVTGHLTAQKEHNRPDIAVEYAFKNKQLVQIWMALHKTKPESREYLQIEYLTTMKGIPLPLTATKLQYDKLLGAGKASHPKHQPQCGTYFGEGFYSDLYYGNNLHMELKDGRMAAWRSVKMQGTANKIHTDKGTVTASTTLEDLKSIFFNKDSWIILELDTGTKDFQIPDGPDSENVLRFHFNQKGQLENVSLYIFC